MSGQNGESSAPPVEGWLERRFQIRARGSTLRRECWGGLATFLTLSYILFVQPAVMCQAMPNEPRYAASVLTAVCLASALACFLMGWLANFPVALAPAMGHNFFFALTVCAPVALHGLGFTWQQALAANLLAGIVFLLLSLLGLFLPRLDPRVLLFGAIPKGMQNAIGLGIGLLIALVGFEFAGIVINKPGTYIGLGFGKIPWKFLAVPLAGLAVFGVCWARRIIGAPLLALLASAATGLVLQVTPPPAGVLAAPTLSATAFQLDFPGLFAQTPAAVLGVIATFLFLDVFDTVGTLAGVCRRAHLVDARGEIGPGVGGAFVADAAGTVAGAALGTSTLTSYVESLAGIAAGARTGLAACCVGALFLLALFFQPLLSSFAAAVPITLPVGFDIPGGATALLHPCLAPVLIGIGAIMMACVKEIDWEDPTEAFPAFLCALGMAFTFSITDGIAFGFISHVVLKTAAGRRREIKPLVAICALLLLLRYVSGLAA